MKEAMMESSPLFSVLTEEQRTVIADRMALETRRQGDLIYQQGRPATALYLIKSGWARLLNDQLAVLVNLRAGDLLGEADVFSGRAYSTSAEAATDLFLWVLSAADLKAIMAEHPEIGRALKSALGIGDEVTTERHLRRLELMSGLTHDQLQEVAGRLRPVHFGAGHGIYCRGSEGDALYLIDQGQVQVSGASGVLATLGAGEIFGEGGFLTGDTRSTDVSALTDVVAWSLGRTDFEELALRYPNLALNLSRVLSRRLRERNLRATATVQITQAPAQAAPQPAPSSPAVAGALTGLNRAAGSATSWWGSRSTGAKLRLVAVIILLIWLLGVAAPSLIISLLSRNSEAGVANNVARASYRERAVLVALAADLPVDITPTYTPWPTETPMPTPTFTPTATPTNTPIPTPTFTPTNTPVPPTPVPPTRAPVRVQARQAPAAAPAAAPVAAAAAPAPSVQFKLTEMRRLTACENRGKHNIFVKVVDGAGNPVDGVIVVQSPSGQPGNVIDKMVSGTKGPGLAEFTMWKGAEYAVYVSNDGANPTSTDIAQPLHSGFADEQMCEDGGGGNTLFHNSFNLIFQKNF